MINHGVFLSLFKKKFSKNIYILNCIENSGLKSRFQVSVNLPETSPIFICLKVLGMYDFGRKKKVVTPLLNPVVAGPGHPVVCYASVAFHVTLCKSAKVKDSFEFL
jgi:hypothetical protein